MRFDVLVRTVSKRRRLLALAALCLTLRDFGFERIDTFQQHPSDFLCFDASLCEGNNVDRA